jgi:hypothetical protein
MAQSVRLSDLDASALKAVLAKLVQKVGKTKPTWQPEELTTEAQRLKAAELRGEWNIVDWVHTALNMKLEKDNGLQVTPATRAGSAAA